MNADKLKRLQAQVRIGGKGTPRRKKKVVHQSAATDDKKLQSSLKKLSVSTIPGIEEVNIIKDDLTVIHFNNPKAQASLSANTFAVTGHGESKKIVEMLPEILPQLDQDTVMQLRMFANTMSQGANKSGAILNDGNINSVRKIVDEEDEVPLLVNDFEQVAKLEEASKVVNTTKVVTFEAGVPFFKQSPVETIQLDKRVESKIEVAPILTEVPTVTSNNKKTQQTADEITKDEKKGKKSNKQQQQDQINVHDGAAKNKTETTKVAENKKAKQMKAEKTIIHDRKTSTPLNVSGSVKNNKKDQGNHTIQMSPKDDGKIKEETKAIGKLQQDDIERKVEGKKVIDELESIKSGQDVKLKEKSLKSKEISNETKSTKKDNLREGNKCVKLEETDIKVIEDKKNVEKNDMDLIKNEKVNESKSLQTSAQPELTKESKNENLKSENKQYVRLDNNQIQAINIEKDVIKKKEDISISESKLDAKSANEKLQTKSTSELTKIDNKENEQFKKNPSEMDKHNLTLDVSLKVNEIISADGTSLKNKGCEVGVSAAATTTPTEIAVVEKVVDTNQNENVKTKNDESSKKTLNKETVSLSAKDKTKNLKLDVNKSKQSDGLISTGVQARSAPILEGSKSPKIQTPKKDSTSIKNLEKQSVSSKAMKQNNGVMTQVKSSALATSSSPPTASSSPISTELKLVATTQNDADKKSSSGSPFETTAASQMPSENITRVEVPNVCNIKNMTDISPKLKGSAKSKNTGKVSQDSQSNIEKTLSRQNSNKAMTPTKPNIGAVTKTSIKADGNAKPTQKQTMPTKPIADITSKSLQQPPNKSASKPTASTVDVINGNVHIENSKVAPKLEADIAQTMPNITLKETQQLIASNTTSAGTTSSQPQSSQSITSVLTSTSNNKNNTQKQAQKVAQQPDTKQAVNVTPKSSQQSTMKLNEKSKLNKQHQMKMKSSDKISADVKERPNSPTKMLDVQLKNSSKIDVTGLNKQETIESIKDLSPVSMSKPLVEQSLVVLDTSEKMTRLDDKDKHVTVSTVSIVSVKTEPTATISSNENTPTNKHVEKTEREIDIKTPTTTANVLALQESTTQDKLETSKHVQASLTSNIGKHMEDVIMPPVEVKVSSQSAITEKSANNSELLVTKSQGDNECLPKSEVSTKSSDQIISLSPPLKKMQIEDSKQMIQQDPLDKLNKPNMASAVMSAVSANINISPSGDKVQIVQTEVPPLNILDETAKQTTKQSSNETQETLKIKDSNSNDFF